MFAHFGIIANAANDRAMFAAADMRAQTSAFDVLDNAVEGVGGNVSGGNDDHVASRRWSVVGWCTRVAPASRAAKRREARAIGTGLAVVWCVSASVARRPIAVAHAGRRKIKSGGGVDGEHVECRVRQRAQPVNIFARMHEPTRDHLHAPTADASDEPTPCVAFQGELGAFSEIAIRQHWPNGARLLPCRTFVDTVHAVCTGDAHFAAIPVENAIAGVVHAAREALDHAPALLRMVGTEVIPVQLCLMAPRGATLESLRSVHSHQMALAQCRMFFSRHAWLEATVHDDTAGAAHDVASRADVTQGAIAADAAATRYGLELLAREIQDSPDNWTRFVIVCQ